ncbi:HNH endonuclease signature motif containing protein [Smaragdicoccus niigatensis]|uniref:HNH endonuclease signature motif containing protein n=1 Tax=Smaragdicoccus niigatensis TaxID=359359 RepID=UPI00035D9768|nr:HNH endonuclease signature motif containing protein [Smaragdicoccus niigatensis]
MGENSVQADEAVEVLAAMRAALPLQASGTRADQAALFVEIETLKRQLDALSYRVLAELETRTDDSLGIMQTVDAVADAARLEKKDVRARLRIAADLTPRVMVSGEVVAPNLEYVAEVVNNGTVGREHLTVIRRFFKNLPRVVEPDARVFAEQQLADWATQFRPDELAKLADRLRHVIDPDGTLDDDLDRARKRHFTLHKQGSDKMVSGTFCLTPEAAAYLEAYLAKFARRGMCNPADAEPTIDHDPTEADIKADTRTYGQRCHDALVAMLRAILMSGDLGQHRGMPVTVIITADITALDPALGAPQAGRTGGSLDIPISDVLRMAGHAELFLATLFGDATPVELYHGRTRRIASPGQRLMLAATERGCSFPGCDRGAYYTQAHHAVDDWTDGGRTNIDELAPACDVHHPLAGPGLRQWRTTKNHLGWTVWIPPKIIDPERKPRVNHFHHPERRLRGAM